MVMGFRSHVGWRRPAIVMSFQSRIGWRMLAMRNGLLIHVFEAMFVEAGHA